MRITSKKLRNIIKESIMEEMNSTDSLDINAQISNMAERLQRLSQELQYNGRFIDRILKNTLGELDKMFNSNIDVIDTEIDGNQLRFTINITPEQIANKAISDEDILQELTGDFGDYEGMSTEELKLEIMSDPSMIFDYIVSSQRFNNGRGFSVDFEYYQSPIIVIETPINFGAFESINKIMDF